jgi:hypothetical protein
MAKTVKANRAQVRAARLIVSRASRGIGQASAAVRAIANAEPVRTNEAVAPATAAVRSQD